VGRADTFQQIHAARPDSFRERGVAVPFTTPALCPGRMRVSHLADNGGPARRSLRAELELVLPNPSGGRGAYVVGWADLRQLFTPTVHDTKLCERLAAIERPAAATTASAIAAAGAVTPSEVRRVARDVAHEGFAGRPAATAAIEAARRSERMQADAYALFADALAASGLRPHSEERTARDRRTAHHLAQAFAECGVGPTAAEARAPLLIHAVSRLAHEAAAAETSCAGAAHEALNAVILAAELTATLAGRALAAARQRCEHIPTLLQDWLTDSAEVAAAAGRADLLLDGWDRICGLWRSIAGGEGHEPGPQDEAYRDVTIREMAACLPPLPGETDRWFDLPPGTVAQAAARRGTFAQPPAGDFIACEMIARNEIVRALAA
jgi:hypothetical protein